ncbi:MAG: hypothetical protein KAR12_17350 [Methylococcales bacterium]|nr:hypothetical protein [Methylococcales bacterium]
MHVIGNGVYRDACHNACNDVFCGGFYKVYNNDPDKYNDHNKQDKNNHDAPNKNHKVNNY